LSGSIGSGQCDFESVAFQHTVTVRLEPSAEPESFDLLTHPFGRDECSLYAYFPMARPAN
jgi:hypothetical protein